MVTVIAMLLLGQKSSAAGPASCQGKLIGIENDPFHVLLVSRPQRRKHVRKAKRPAAQSLRPLRPHILQRYRGNRYLLAWSTSPD
jgi:hypothetical protein